MSTARIPDGTPRRYDTTDMHCGQCGAALEHTGYWDACGMVPFCDAVCLDGWRGDG